MTSMSTYNSLVEKIKAAYPSIYLKTSEDTRSRMEIERVATALGRSLYTWTFGSGLIQELTGRNNKIQNTETPLEVCDVMGKNTIPQKSIIVLRQFHHFLLDPLVQIKLLDLIPRFKTSRRTMIILSPVLKIPEELIKELAFVESLLPQSEELMNVIDGIVRGSDLKGKMKPNAELKKKLVDAALGMTTSEADNAFSLSIIRPKIQKDTTKTWDPKVVMEEKCSALKKAGLLEYIAVQDEGMSQVGGMEILKSWVSKRKRAFTKEAKEFGLDTPKGLLLVGPPGSGKSLGARAISSELHLPLLKCDLGKMYGSLVGQSEENIRNALHTAETIAPCILWIDEIEKGLPNTGGGGGDSGVSDRVLGTILSWMQDKTEPVFVYATANDVTKLPPELLRKGRFDEMFSVLLPSIKERKEIFSIHIKKRGREALLGKINLDTLAKSSDGFSGAEIEAVVSEALYAAFDAGKDLNDWDLMECVSDTRPLSQTMHEALEKLRVWCIERTRPANLSNSDTKSNKSGRWLDA